MGAHACQLLLLLLLLSAGAAATMPSCSPQERKRLPRQPAPPTCHPCPGADAAALAHFGMSLASAGLGSHLLHTVVPSGERAMACGPSLNSTTAAALSALVASRCLPVPWPSIHSGRPCCDASMAAAVTPVKRTRLSLPPAPHPTPMQTRSSAAERCCCSTASSSLSSCPCCCCRRCGARQRAPPPLPLLPGLPREGRG